MGQELNEQRAEWALAALDTFANDTYSGRDVSQLPEVEREDCLCDLICDLMHLADVFGVDFGRLLVRATDHYNFEVQTGE